RRGKPTRIIRQQAGSLLRSSAGFVPRPHIALWRDDSPRKGELKRLAVVRLALLGEGILPGLGLLPCQSKRREGGAALLLLVRPRLRLLLFLVAAHLTLGHGVPPVLACPPSRAVDGLKRRGRTDSSGVSLASIRPSLASFAVSRRWDRAAASCISRLYTFSIYLLTTQSVSARVSQPRSLRACS